LCLPTRGMSLSGFESQLDAWEAADGFVPTVAIIDYMDNLDADDPKKDFRLQENEKWGRARALSLRRHLCIVAFTQANAASYKQRTLRIHNFSETKGKNAHVTAMVGINQDRVEKRNGVVRYNMMFVREGEYDDDDECNVLTALRRGRSCLASF